MGMRFTYGSMVFSLAFLAPGGGLAIMRNMISVETIEALATLLEDQLAGSNISYTGVICRVMRLLTIGTLRVSM